MNLPIDIKKKVLQDYNYSDGKKVIYIFEQLYSENINTKIIIQVIRSVLFLADGDFDVIKEYCNPSLQVDPRDIVMEAEEMAGNPGHWFSITFDDMKGFNGELPETEEYNNDDLSF
ncbi:hypothetical protein [Flammeovirga aprica]|uniref:Uncharacterized protein n=1 Tax=Flammeovirga aprica JL-4 TaxID=694437 RepID=A0A7X9S221_9BACT|nr:hypothetical protein [Flammeovirga aprica]NME72950.1 hypothetical protein [Flammeovirga aprica JL-4]